MDGTTEPVFCPPLYHDAITNNVTLSTLARHVGSLVEVGCLTNEILNGSRFLECRPGGVWSDSLPVCFTTEDVSTIFPNMTSSTNSTLPVEDKPEIDVVILIVWVVGGLLLILLLVLIGCILRTHQKIRRNSRRSHGNQQGQNARHGGGVNPSFTTYDEIWTWIPVVTDSSANCNSQVNPSARLNILQEPTQEAALMSRLRLPTYNEAVRNSAGNSGNQGTVQTPLSERQGSNVAVAVVASTSRTPVTTATTTALANNQAAAYDANDVNGVTDQQHYETIPADIHTLPRSIGTVYETAPTLPMATSTLRQATSNVNAPRATANSNANYVTSVAVTSSSGRALADARALVHQTGNHSRSVRNTPGHQSPVRRGHNEVSTNSTRGIQIDTYHATVVEASRGARVTRSAQEVTRASRHPRERSHRDDPELGQEFHRSSASAFMSYREQQSRPRTSNYHLDNSCRLESWHVLPSNGPGGRYLQQQSSAPVVRLNYF